MPTAQIITDGARLQFSEAVQYFDAKLKNFPTEHWADVWNEAHTQGFMVAGATSEALLDDFRAAVRKALVDGTTLATFRKDFDAIVKKHGWQHTGHPGWRASIIYQTNTAMAYSAGQYRQLWRNRDGFPYWRYVHGMHGRPQRPRPQHEAWNGLILRCDDPFWDTHFPPNGWRCTCGVEPVSAGEMKREGLSLSSPPEVKYRDWTNKRTGEVLKVPEGIDPGFGYNPGRAWRDGVEQAERAAKGAGAPPSVPLTGDRPLAGEARPIARDDGVARPADHVSPADAVEWIEDQVAYGRSDKTVRVVGRIADDVKVLPEGAPREIVLSAKRVYHMAREEKAKVGRRLSLDDLRAIPRHLAQPDAIYLNRGDLVYTFAGPRPGMIGRIVVGLMRAPRHGRDPANVVLTAGYTKGYISQRDPQYQLLWQRPDDGED